MKIETRSCSDDKESGTGKYLNDFVPETDRFKALCLATRHAWKHGTRTLKPVNGYAFRGSVKLKTAGIRFQPVLISALAEMAILTAESGELVVVTKNKNYSNMGLVATVVTALAKDLIVFMTEEKHRIARNEVERKSLQDEKRASLQAASAALLEEKIVPPTRESLVGPSSNPAESLEI